MNEATPFTPIAPPKGRTDGAGRWYPHPSEIKACCNAIRSPSRRYPWSLLKHCLTAKHRNAPSLTPDE